MQSLNDPLVAYPYVVPRLDGVTFTGGTTGLFDYFSASGESHRQAVNHWLRNGAGLDSVADFDAALSDPTEPTRLDARFD